MDPADIFTTNSYAAGKRHILDPNKGLDPDGIRQYWPTLCGHRGVPERILRRMFTDDVTALKLTAVRCKVCEARVP